MKKKEYQTGTVTFSKVEDGWFNNWLTERSNTGWKLKTTERFFSVKHQEDSLFWILEREVEEV
ncbi:MAG: hypothetical protein HQ536_04290 [Parcubacteria group bacterium]|nr:hypothetical protein [Parcubacteria group bacterium]